MKWYHINKNLLDLSSDKSNKIKLIPMCADQSNPSQYQQRLHLKKERKPLLSLYVRYHTTKFAPAFAPHLSYAHISYSVFQHITAAKTLQHWCCKAAALLSSAGCMMIGGTSSLGPVF